MTSHELAKKLLDGPNLPVVVHNDNEGESTYREVQTVEVGTFQDDYGGPPVPPRTEEMQDRVLIDWGY